MKKIIYITVLTSLVYACKQTSSEFSNHENRNQNIISSVDTIKTNLEAKKLSKLDSIEKENNESVIVAGDNVTKAYASLKEGDSIINLVANIRKDHRIFGYAKPDIKSERLLLLSIFTNDVKNNPFNCRLGAYYDTQMMNDLILKYNSTMGNFVKATAIDKAGNSTTIYFEKKWIELE